MLLCAQSSNEHKQDMKNRINIQPCDILNVPLSLLWCDGTKDSLVKDAVCFLKLFGLCDE